MEKLYTFKANEVIALDGIHSVSITKGKPMPVPAKLAASLLEQGRIVEAGTEAPTYETKDTPTESNVEEKTEDAPKATKKAKKAKKKKA